MLWMTPRMDSKADRCSYMALDSEVQGVVLILTQLEKCRKSDEDAALPFFLQDASFAGLQCLEL